MCPIRTSGSVPRKLMASRATCTHVLVEPWAMTLGSGEGQPADHARVCVAQVRHGRDAKVMRFPAGSSGLCQIVGGWAMCTVESAFRS